MIETRERGRAEVVAIVEKGIHTIGRTRERLRRPYEREQVYFVSTRLHYSMRMRAAPRTIVAPHFQPQKSRFQHPCT